MSVEDMEMAKFCHAISFSINDLVSPILLGMGTFCLDCLGDLYFF